MSYDGLYTLHIDYGLIQDDFDKIISKSNTYDDKKLFKLLDKMFEIKIFKDITEEYLDNIQESDYSGYIGGRFYNHTDGLYYPFKESAMWWKNRLSEVRDRKHIKRRLESYEIRDYYDGILIASEFLVALIDEKPTKAFELFCEGCGGTPRRNKNLNKKFHDLKSRCDKKALKPLVSKALALLDYFYTQKGLEMYGLIDDQSEDWIASLDELKEKLKKIGVNQ